MEGKPMAPDESARLIRLESRLFRRLEREGPPTKSLEDRRSRGLRFRSDYAIRHAEQLRHCFRWLRQQPTA
jgi:hypothetical protein